jgi:hypothetical protein
MYATVGARFPLDLGYCNLVITYQHHTRTTVLILVGGLEKNMSVGWFYFSEKLLFVPTWLHTGSYLLE